MGGHRGRAEPERESPCAITLAQAILKGDRMSWLVQKATELGVSRIVPMETARVVARPDTGGAARHTRWERIAREAVERCGRESCRGSTDRERSRTWWVRSRGTTPGGSSGRVAARRSPRPPRRRACQPVSYFWSVPRGASRPEEVGGGQRGGGTSREPRTADPSRRVGGPHGSCPLSVPVRRPGRPAAGARGGGGRRAVTPEGYEYFDVAADVGVSAWGEDLPGCLRQCALGVFNLIVPIYRRPAARGSRGGGARRIGRGPLGELAERMPLRSRSRGLRRFRHRPAGGHHDRGARSSPRRARRSHAAPRGTIVKAATLHGLEVRDTPGRVSARVVLDI